MFSHSLNLSALYMVILGFAFPGKNIVGLNYLLEFTPMAYHTKFITTKMVCECMILYLMSKGFENVSRHWLWIHLSGLVATLLSLIIAVFIIPESPKFLYLKKRYSESRNILKYIARFNKSYSLNNDDFLFDTEYHSMTKKGKTEEIQPLLSRDVPIIEQCQELSDNEYQWNLFKMVNIWTATVFASYLIMFQLKYLKGNIFHNTNSYAFSDAISRVFGGLVYSNYGLKKSLVIAYMIAMFGGIGIYFI